MEWAQLVTLVGQSLTNASKVLGQSGRRARRTGAAVERAPPRTVGPHPAPRAPHPAPRPWGSLFGRHIFFNNPPTWALRFGPTIQAQRGSVRVTGWQPSDSESDRQRCDGGSSTNLVGRRAARARPAAKGAGCCAPRCRASVRAHWLGAGRCDGGGRHRDRARWCSMASAIPSCGAQLERCPTQRRRAMASTYRKGRWTSSPPRVPSTWPQCTPGSAPHRA